ncbi:MAG: transglutaminase domain-containing protein [Bacteroides sp.]|nr:transglutaminase domain-containing protein [Bacteroides sp.]
MKTQIFLSIALITAGYQVSVAEVENNIVITESIDNYTFIPDKHGTGIASIKHNSSNTFMATRVPGAALDYVFYDSFTKVNKANVKAKGVKPVYQSAISGGIFYDDSKICAVTVPLEEINKPVKTEFETTSSRPDLEPFMFLGSRYPIKHGTINITMPVGFKDNIDICTSNFGDNVSVSRGVSTNGRDWTITIDYHDMPALDSSGDAPPARYIYPSIQFIGNFADAQELYRHLHSFTISADPDMESVKIKALEITAGCNDDEARIEAIYNWVHQNIRYVAIEHGDLGSIPDHASEVLRKRYGDCKGSANLIKAMLNSIGMDGRLVWIGTSSVPYDFTDRPSFPTGNHMIAATILPNDSIIYLDGTVGLADYGVYGACIQGKQTLVENGDNCIVGRVPVQDPLTNDDVTDLNLTLADNSLTGTVTGTLTGSDKASLLNRLNDNTPDKYREILENSLTRRRKSWHITDATLTNGTPGNGAAILTANVKIDNVIRRAGNKQYLTLELLPGISAMQFNSKNRKYGGWINSFGRTMTKVTIKFDRTMIPSELPEPIVINNQWITARIECKLSDDTLTAEAEITFKSHLIPLEYLERYNTDIKQVTKGASMTLVINTVTQ